jgi:hypothetical protein
VRTLDEASTGMERLELDL